MLTNNNYDIIVTWKKQSAMPQNSSSSLTSSFVQAEYWDFQEYQPRGLYPVVSFFFMCAQWENYVPWHSTLKQSLRNEQQTM